MCYSAWPAVALIGVMITVLDEVYSSVQCTVYSVQCTVYSTCFVVCDCVVCFTYYCMWLDIMLCM